MRAVKEFSDRTIKSKEFAPKDKPYVKAEAGGLYLRVYPNGRKAWLCVYSIDGKRKWFTLGTYPTTSLEKARKKHRHVKELLDDGKDPALVALEEKIERRQAPAVEELVKEYLEKWAKPRKKSWEEDKRALEKDVTPTWGKRKAKDITKRDVVLLLESLVERGSPVQSNNLLEKVRKMFNFAVERDILKASPCHGVRPLHKRESKERTLAEEEIKTFWTSLDTASMSDEAKRALKLILVTAQRPGEVAGMHSREIEGRWWTIPAERSKNGKAHRVYLTDLAVEIIGEVPENAHLFSPGRFYGEDGKHKRQKVGRPGDPIQGNSLAQALRKNLSPDKEAGASKIPIKAFTPHDLRRTAATNMASLGYGIVVDKVLNHTDRRVTAIYDRYSYDREKQLALEAWGRKLEGIVSGRITGNVIPFTGIKESGG
jgi:integrase